ncbi:hypothetical protein [Emticicia fontis]
MDAYKRMAMVHDYEYCSREPDKIDIISIQNWRSDLSQTAGLATIISHRAVTR